MESDQMKTDGAQPLELLVANDAVAICEKLESDFRNKGDYCHNNIGSKTCDDWERMDKFLVAAAYEIRKIRNDVKNLVALYSRQKLRQCDVGTAEEQFDRFAKHCIGKDCGSCEHGDGVRVRSLAHCALRWAQTPYKTQEGAGK